MKENSLKQFKQLYFSPKWLFILAAAYRKSIPYIFKISLISSLKLYKPHNASYCEKQFQKEILIALLLMVTVSFDKIPSFRIEQSFK